MLFGPISAKVKKGLTKGLGDSSITLSQAIRIAISCGIFYSLMVLVIVPLVIIPLANKLFYPLETNSMLIDHNT
jgi:hypothetical protein